MKNKQITNCIKNFDEVVGGREEGLQDQTGNQRFVVSVGKRLR